MGFGGVLAQYATDAGPDVDRAIRSLVGQLLGFVLIIAFGLWLMRRSRANRANRPPVSGWYADPWGAPYQRWWNGAAWTANVREQPWPGPHAGAHPGARPDLYPGAHQGPGAPPGPGTPPGPSAPGSQWGSPPPGSGGSEGPYPPV